MNCRAVLPIAVIFLLLSLVAPLRAQSKRLTETPIADAPAYAKTALVIGIDQYELCSPLGGSCAKDAKAFAALLQTKFGFTNVVLMTDDAPNAALRPTGAHLKRALQTLYGGLTAGESEVVVFYSGHGTRDTEGGSDRDYLVPSDGDPADVPGTCIDYEAVRSKIETKNPLRALLITDACRDLLGGKGVRSTKKGFGGADQAPVADPQIAELRSCKPGETSRVADKDFTGSVFTHYLIQGLSGDPDAVAPGTTEVTFDSLSRYVKGSVHQYVAREFNDQQTPTGLATQGAMMLARRSLTLPEQQAANARLLALWTDAQGKLSDAKAKFVTVAAVREALNAGAEVNAKDSRGNTALMNAAFGGSSDVFQALLDAGADVNAKDASDYTALHIAILSEHTDILKMLILAGANVNAKTADGATALMVAANDGNTGVVKALLAAGADINAKDKDGVTSLLLAAYGGNTETIKALLAAGANVNAKTGDGITPLMAADNPKKGVSPEAKAANLAVLKAAGAKE